MPWLFNAIRNIDYMLHLISNTIINLFIHWFLGCPRGLHFLGRHEGGLVALIKIMKHAYTEYGCSAMFCDTDGFRCRPIIWSKSQKNFVMDKDCETDIAIHGAWKGWITCGGCGKGKHNIILPY